MSPPRDQLFEIIQNGRQFLAALEQFAAINFPNDGGGGAEGMAHPHSLQGGEVGRVDDAERYIDDDDRQMATEESTHSVDSDENETSPPTEEETDALANNPPRAKRMKFKQAVAQFCAKTGAVLAQYHSLNEAAERVAESMPSNTKVATCKHAIYVSLRGCKQTPVYKGFYFRLIGDASTPMPSFPIVPVRQSAENTGAVVRKKRTPVLQFCAKTGQQLGRFETVTAAAKFLASSTPAGLKERQFRSGISDILNVTKKRPVYEGFYFRYATDTSPFPEFPIPDTYGEWKNTELGRQQLEEQRKKREEMKERRQQGEYAVVPAESHPLITGEDNGRKRQREEQNVTTPGSSHSNKKAKHKKRSPILQFCSKTGKYIRRFETGTAAAKFLAARDTTPGSNKERMFRSAVSDILSSNKKRKSFRGFYFRYLNDIMTPFPAFPMPEPQHTRQYTSLVEQQQNQGDEQEDEDNEVTVLEHRQQDEQQEEDLEASGGLEQQNQGDKQLEDDDGDII